MHADEWVRRTVDTGVLGVLDPRLFAAYQVVRRFVWRSKTDVFENVTAYAENGYVTSRVSRPKLATLVGIATPQGISRLTRELRALGWLDIGGARRERVYLLGEWQQSKRPQGSTYGVALYWYDAWIDALARYQCAKAEEGKLHAIDPLVRVALAREWIKSNPMQHRVKHAHGAVAGQ